MNIWMNIFESLFGERMTRYNNGKCTECGHYLIMYHTNPDGSHDYRCPKCGHEVDAVERWEVNKDYRITRNRKRR